MSSWPTAPSGTSAPSFPLIVIPWWRGLIHFRPKAGSADSSLIALGLAVAIEGRPEQLPIGVARCFRSQEAPTLAEVALITRDDWQGAGAGTALMQALAEAAWNVGIRRWFGALFCDNHTIRNLLSRVGDLGEDRVIGSGVVEVVCDLYPPIQPIPSLSPDEATTGQKLP
jgi:GNAT superfamily N-acetyltransferase